jgi:hypothetical protein
MVFIKSSFTVLILAGLFILKADSVLAQNDRKIRYYVTLNEVNERSMVEVSDYVLNLQYNDAYGGNKEFVFRIYDWERKTIALLQMDKRPGVNQYSIQLNEIYSQWQTGKVYYGEMKNEVGQVYTLPIRIVKAPEKPDPVANIMVNPVRIGCSDNRGTSVEFYGDISGGAAPYTIKWFVLNDNRTDLLYQPKEEYLEMAGKTSMIIVDKGPVYNVILYIKDACGKEDKQIVTLTCGADDKKINTVFVEEFAMPTFGK